MILRFLHHATRQPLPHCALPTQTSQMQYILQIAWTRVSHQSPCLKQSACQNCQRCIQHPHTKLGYGLCPWSSTTVADHPSHTYGFHQMTTDKCSSRRQSQVRQEEPCCTWLRNPCLGDPHYTKSTRVSP